LLVAGVHALEALLPGFTDELLELGALRSDVLRDSVWVMRGAPLARFDSGLVGLLGTRLLLESHIRRRVRALAGVTLLGQHDILGLTATPDGARITGAAIAARDEGRLVTMEADLVVDATGRGSRAPRWLAELDYSAPPTQEVAIDIRYVSRFFQDVPGLLEGTDAVVVAAQPPKLAGGIALRQEGGTWLVMLSGRHGLQPPTELTEFAEFADTLPTPALRTWPERRRRSVRPRPTAFPRADGATTNSSTAGPTDSLPSVTRCARSTRHTDKASRPRGGRRSR